MSWFMIVAFAIGTFAMRATGPLIVGGRRLPKPIEHMLTVLPLALLAAVVTLQAGLATGIDARAAGLLAALPAVLLRAPFPVVFVIGAAATAACRYWGS